MHFNNNYFVEHIREDMRWGGAHHLMLNKEGGSLMSCYLHGPQVGALTEILIFSTYFSLPPLHK